MYEVMSWRFECRSLGLNCTWKVEDRDRDAVLAMAKAHMKANHRQLNLPDSDLRNATH